MSEVKLCCPECQGTDFKAVEQFTVLTPVTFIAHDKIDPADSHVEIDVDPVSEFRKEDATSVTQIYLCANSDCTFSIHPTGLDTLPRTLA